MTACCAASRSSNTIAGWISGEGAIYAIPAGVTVKAVKYRETGCDTRFAGAFHCNDHDYNILWQKATRTCYVCMRDHFMDCPDRERAEWLGDAVLQMEECFYAFDTASHAICKKLVLSKQINGLPGQNLIAHGEYGDWNYYLYTGDLATLTAIYSSTREYLQRYVLGETGLPVHRPEQGDWYDWGTGFTDKEVIQVAQYYTALKALRKMAEATGNVGDIPAMEAILKSIHANFDKVFWKEDGYRSGGDLDERANAMAVVAGLAEPSRWDAIDKVLAAKMNCGPYFERWVSEALCVMRKPERALLRMSQRYQLQIQAGFSTLWEYMDRACENYIPNNTDSPEYISLNHAWNTPNLILSKFIAGVAPVKPGWSTYHVLPQEAFLTAIKVTVATVRGDIQVAIHKDATRYKIGLISPPNTTAIVGIPKASFTTLTAIQANGKTVWAGSFKGAVPGLAWHGEDSNYIKFAVTPGAWSFVAAGSLPITTPKPPAQPSSAVKLAKKFWTVTASSDHQQYHGGPWSGRSWPVDASAANAIDEDYWTGWRTIDAQKPPGGFGSYSGQQTPGQWIVVDMKRPQVFAKVVLDHSWAPYDFPQSYALHVSNNPEDWGTPVASGKGHAGMTTIVLPQTTGRYLKIIQTGAKGNPWSIFELNVYR